MLFIIPARWKKRREKKKAVEKRECEKNTQKKKESLRYFYTRAKRKIAVGYIELLRCTRQRTERNFVANFLFIYDVEKYLEKFSRYPSKENAFERYLLFAQFFSAVHKCFPNVNSQRYVFCRGNDVPLNAAVPRERERQRPRFKRGYPTRSSQPGERKIIAG